MSGKLYCTSPEREIKIIILKGEYVDFSRAQHQYSDIFNSAVKFRSYTKDFLNGFWSNNNSFDKDCVHVFLMGQDLSYQEEADYSRNFKNMSVDEFIFANVDSFKDFIVKVPKVQKVLHKCYCNSLELFRYGCKCGGR